VISLNTYLIIFIFNNFSIFNWRGAANMSENELLIEVFDGITPTGG
jgi:hypothetical protein